MLTAETKRTIDAARDVLVGKVPDPKAQVEQITTALIYKFMHDLDQESVALGGQAKYFSGDYQKFAWSSLLDTRLSGEARLDLYVQAVTSLERNPNLPQLFRDIFKGAFLPYNDPQTLTLFLKEINKFRYDHSEELGNAFEYLLSVLGSQGDAGQFRTPRHIIDFMVEVIDPHKHETILDPACGTAGFLISAFKHIRKHNSSNFKPEGNHKDALGESAPELILADSALYSGDRLTPDERKKLTENIQGYDISPDMVRLSLVNLYLHGFPNPRIQEYDTLTSEKNWDESFDVILANPPFMTPKGGIRPHRRFQVQAKRSEVLFVDYILEHLNPGGRAAVIVPEGVIFKSENAYKSLRRLLLDDGLYAVVSLPSGVFNPYAGVKTSILFFDMQLGRRAAELLFVKIDQDGFDLGAQRRRIDRNDLPEALRVLRAWQRGEKMESPLALWAEKARVAADGDYNLSAERYRPVQARLNQKWPLVELGELCEILDSKRIPIKKADRKKGIYPYYGATGILDYVDDFIFDEKLVLVGEDGAKWGAKERTAFIATGRYWVNNHAHVLRPNRDLLVDEFLIPILNMMDLLTYVTGVTVPKLNQEKLKSIKIPLPPLEVQRDIVEQIQVKQDAIDAARALIASLEKERRFFARELQDREDVEWVELGEVCDIVRGGSPRPIKEHITNSENGINWIKIGDVSEGQKYITSTKEKIKPDSINKTRLVYKGDIILSNSMSFGRPYILAIDGAIHDGWLLLHIKNEKVLKDYIYLILGDELVHEQFKRFATGGVVNNLNIGLVSKVKIPIPCIEIQKKLINESEFIEKMISNNQQIIKSMEKKIEQVLETIF